MRILRDLRERRIFRFVVAYLAVSWAGLEVADQFVDNDILPGWVYRGVFALVMAGFPGALIVSWFHGAKGRQEMPAVEAWMLAGVAVFAVVTTGLVIRAEIRAESEIARAAQGLAPVEDPRRVAVLYFEPRGGEEAGFLASGLTEALIDQLSEVSALHVASRNASQQFRGVAVAPDSIGRTLHVGSLVEGTVAQAGETVRVEVALTSAASGAQIARTRLERPRSEIFALQDELADTVAVFLRQRIGTEFGALTLRAGTRSVPAWERVQEAELVVREADLLAAGGDLEGATRTFLRADSLLSQAEASDPAWIEPVVRRGWFAYRVSRLGGMDRSHYEEWIDRGLGHAGRALARDPRHAAALELRATLQYWTFLLNLAGTPAEADELFHAAEDGLRAAIAADPNRASARNSLSHLLTAKGEIAEAKIAALQAYTTDPFLENANLTIWRIFLSSWNLQDQVEARRYCEEGVRRFPDDFRFAQCRLMLQALPGAVPDPAEAWRLAELFTERSPAQVREVNRLRGRVYVAMALARAGLPDSARAVASTARADPAIDPVQEVALLESIVRTWIGDMDEAVRLLSLHLAANPGGIEGYHDQASQGNLPWYHRGLLEEPRFRSLVGLR